MPYKPRWWSRINEIEASVRTLKQHVLDRSCFETLFGVSRRQAHALMDACGGYQAGRTWLVERSVLLRYLRHLQLHPDFRFERQRRKALAASLTAAQRWARAQTVTIAVAPAEFRDQFGVHEQVHWEPGRLSIPFSSEEELLGRLYRLSQQIAGDYDGFVRFLQPYKDHSQTAP